MQSMPVSSASSPLPWSGMTSSNIQFKMDAFFAKHFGSNPDFFKQAFKLAFCFFGLQISYLSWGYLQELIMTTEFTPTIRVKDGKFPSAAFCVFSNRFLALVISLIIVKIKHGKYFAVAPAYAFTPCALSNTVSSYCQYLSLRYVTFPVQTVFKSSKIIPVMIMGKILKNESYKWSKYTEALLITLGVAIFSVLSKEPKEGDDGSGTEFIGLMVMACYVFSDCFTSQWQDKVYGQYGRNNVDSFQMMLGVNTSAIVLTIIQLIVLGDIPVVIEFLRVNPNALQYNILTAITSATGQMFIFYTIKEFGPIIFTIMMTTRQMFSIVLSAIIFGHVISPSAALGALLVFGVLFYQIQKKYKAQNEKKKQSKPVEHESLIDSGLKEAELAKV